SLTDVPILVSDEMRDALVAASKARSMSDRIKAFGKIRPVHLKPNSPAIAEPTTGLTMRQSAERKAQEGGISREERDKWARRSHQLAWAATEDGRLTREVAPVFIDGVAITRDNGIRPDSSLEKLAKLKPAFDRRYGTVTAGNASPLTD